MENEEKRHGQPATPGGGGKPCWSFGNEEEEDEKAEGGGRGGRVALGGKEAKPLLG